MRHVLDLAQQQAINGHKVHVVYSPLRLEPLFTPQLANLQSVTLHAIPMHRAPHPHDFLHVVTLVKLCKQSKPNIIHAHSTKAGLIVRLARLFYSTKIIYTPHAIMTMHPDTSRFKKLVYGLYEQVLSPLMNKMIILSSFEQDHARALGLQDKKLTMGLNGIAPLPITQRTAIREDWEIAENDIAVGYVGRLTAQKNPELALNSFAAAYAQNKNLILIMIGDGELTEACKALAQQLGITDRIRWLGAQDAKMHYAGMDMLLVTSRYEGMAYTFIEALHAGLPVVSTTVGGSDRCIMHGQNGYVVSADAHELATHLLMIANDPVLCDAMRFAARSLSRSFTIQAMTQYHDGIYKDA